jgi:hypothetical protein
MEVGEDKMRCQRDEITTPPHQNSIPYVSTYYTYDKQNIHKRLHKCIFNALIKDYTSSRKSKQPNNHMSKGPRAA